MFKFLLKLLGIDQYEYPEYIKPSAKITEAKEPEKSPIVKQKTAEAADQLDSLLIKEPKPTPKPTPKSAAVSDSAKLPEKQQKQQQEQLTAEILVEKVKGLKLNYAKTLIDSGFDSVKKIKSSKDKDLVAIKGIGKATIQLIRKSL